MRKLLSILLIIFLFVLYVMYDRTIKEGLKNFGHKTMIDDAPFAYKTMTNNLKYPDLIEEKKERNDFIKLTARNPHTPKQFNKRKNRSLYSKKNMKTDFKYFNNSANLQLYNYFNHDPMVDELMDNGTYDESEVRSALALTGYDKDAATEKLKLL